MAYGDIGSVIDWLEFDPVLGMRPSIVHVAGNVFAIAESQPTFTGRLYTVTINDDGSIDDAVIDKFDFDTNTCHYPIIKHIAGNVYVIVYYGSAAFGGLCTVEINPDGTIVGVIDRLTSFNEVEPDIIKVAPGMYAIAYYGGVSTIAIADNGDIAASLKDTFQYAPNGNRPSIVHVSGDVYAIAYDDELTSHGWVCTVTIDSSGNIGDAVIDTLEFDPVSGMFPHIVHVSGDVYAIAYSGPSTNGGLVTVTINPDGTIDDALIDTFAYDPVVSNYPCIISIGLGIFAIAYRGPDLDGWLCTVKINDDGSIDDAVIDTLEFDIVEGEYPCIIPHPTAAINGNVYAIVYEGAGDDGWLCTVDINTPPPGAPHHEAIMGMGP